MGTGLFQTATELVSTCSRYVSRAAGKLRKRGRALSRLTTAAIHPLLSHRTSSRKRIAKEEAEEEGVWRRSILMGEKCQPLNFPGVIHYDANGRPLSQVPAPRSPLRHPLPSYPHAVTSR